MSGAGGLGSTQIYHKSSGASRKTTIAWTKRDIKQNHQIHIWHNFTIPLLAGLPKICTVLCFINCMVRWPHQVGKQKLWQNMRVSLRFCNHQWQVHHIYHKSSGTSRKTIMPWTKRDINQNHQIHIWHNFTIPVLAGLPKIGAVLCLINCMVRRPHQVDKQKLLQKHESSLACPQSPVAGPPDLS